MPLASIGNDHKQWTMRGIVVVTNRVPTSDSAEIPQPDWMVCPSAFLLIPLKTQQTAELGVEI